MKLSDIMSAADLAVYAEVGLVLFLVAFLAVVVRVLWPGRAHHYEMAAQIPLSEEPVEPRSRASKEVDSPEQRPKRHGVQEISAEDRGVNL